jgi:protein TonB
LSRRLSEAGRVVLRVFVDAAGNARQIEIHTSSRFERLDQAAVDAVRRWRFAAARLGEQTVAAWVLVPVYFSLRG